MSYQVENSFYKITDHKYPLLVTLSFFLVLSYVTFSLSDYIKDGDFFHYFIYGKQILNGQGKDVALFNAGPGGPIFYAAINTFFNDPFLTAKIISLLSGTGIVFFSYYIIKNIFDHKKALIGQLLIAFNPRLDLISVQALNEIFPIFLIFISFFFITKRDLKLNNVIIVGITLGLSSLIRFQPILIFFSFVIFLLIRDNKIRTNLSYVLVMSIFFLIAFSPSIYYNYVTHGKIIDSNPNYESLIKSKFKTPQWIEGMKTTILSTENTKILDNKLFLQNYFYNLFYHNPNKLFNFDSVSNVSLIPTIPYLGLIPFIGGLVYLLNIKLNKFLGLILISTTIITTFLIILFGDISIHFFAIIIIPLLVLTIVNFKKCTKNFMPLLIASTLFFFFISILPLSRADYLFPIWIVIPTLGSIFFVDALPRIIAKIKLYKKNHSSIPSSKLFIIIIALVLLINLGHSYKTLENYLFEGTFSNIWNEVIESFQNNDPHTQQGIETKKIAEILATQPGIKNSYVMSLNDIYLYYVDTKIILATFQEGISGDPIEKFLTRENWSDFDKYMSNVNSYPADRYGKNNPIPDYLIYGNIPISSWKYDINATQYEDLKILLDPNNPKIPSNLEVLYKSNKGDIVVYKINHEK